MGDRDLALILHRLRHTAAQVGGVSDGELLQRFVASRDEAAFELLLWRHARLVFGVCRRLLHDVHDAEDAFQATMLILARRAGSIEKRDALASWLYKVAYRTALTLRGKRARKAARERHLAAAEDLAAPANATTAAEQEELQEILDHEVSRLPERLRALVVLCYFEGKTVDEAAVQVGCPRGTAASRLARARERLRLRLARRGLALAAGLATIQQAAAAPRPLHLIPFLFSAIMRAASGVTPDVGFSRNALALTNEVLTAMFWHKCKTSSAVVLAFAGILLAGGGLAIHLRASAGPQPEPLAAGNNPKTSATQQEPPKDKPVDASVKISSVKVSHPLRRDFTPYQDYLGRLEAIRTVEVRASVSGRLEKIDFKPGAEVKKGDVLFEVDSTAYRLALDKAEADLASAEANRNRSDAQLQRARRLKENGSIGNEDYDQIGAEAGAARARWKAVKAAVDQAKLNLAATKVTAPVDGIIGQAKIDLGNYVLEERGSLLLATITSLDPIRLFFDMDETSFLRYRRLQRAGEVKGLGSAIAMKLLDEERFGRKGALEGFDVRIDPKTGTIRVSGMFPNHDRLLLPGMSACVRVPFGKPRPVLEIRQQAIFIDQGHQCVYVVNKNDVIEKRLVKESSMDDGLRVIDNGVYSEDWVVFERAAGVRTGDKVKVERTAERDAEADK